MLCHRVDIMKIFLFNFPFLSLADKVVPYCTVFDFGPVDALLQAVLWIRNRIQRGSFIRMRIRIQEGKNYPQT
jgi:hypothetical protein